MSGSSALLAANSTPVTISFNEIPANLAVPGAFVEISANYDQSGLVGYPARALLMAPILGTGTLPTLVPTQCFSAEQGAAMLGSYGIGAQMVAAFIAANPWTSLFVMALPTPSGATASSWTITPAFTATLTGSAGTLALYIGGTKVPVTVTPGVDTVATICASIVAAVTAADLPVTAATVGSPATAVTLTARDLGALAAALDVRFNLNPGDVLPGGQTAGVANLAVPITTTAGTGVHAVATAFAAIASQWFTHCVQPWTDSASLTATATETARRFNAMAGLDMRAFSAISASSISALISAVATMNDRFSSIIGLQNEPTPPWVVASAYGAVAAFNLINDPARQLRGLLLPGVVAPATADVLTETERQQLLTSGVATATVGRDGSVRIERAVTTYLTNASGIADTAWTDIMTAETASRIRYDWIGYVGLTYPRQKMAADGSLAAEYDPTIVTPRRMSGAWTTRSRLYEQLGWIQNSAVTAAQSVFELDVTNPNRMDARMQYQQIGNLMVLAGQMQFSLNGQPSSTAQA